jgi:hypothetical protein
MITLTEEQYNELPDVAKAAFVKNGDLYVVGKDSTLKNSLDALDVKHKALVDELGKFKSDEIDKIALAKKEALAEALKKGDATAIEERYKQEMIDLEVRVAASTRDEVEAEYTAKKAKNKAESLRKSIAKDLGFDADAVATIELLLTSLIKTNESNEISLYDFSGSATSIKGDDEEAVKAEIKKLPQFKYLVSGKDLLKSVKNGILNGGENSVTTTNGTIKQSACTSAYASTITK